MKEQKKQNKFLVVYEDIWHNKESIVTYRIGDAIKEFMESYDVVPFAELDFDKYNSDDPYEVGTFGPGFYDIEFFQAHSDGELEEQEYEGRIMIFDITE